MLYTLFKYHIDGLYQRIRLLKTLQFRLICPPPGQYPPITSTIILSIYTWPFCLTSKEEKVKMLGPLARISNQSGRNVMKSFIRNGSHGGVPGENLPFDINNRTRVTINFFWYVGTGIAAPFIVLWHQMNKN